MPSTYLFVAATLLLSLNFIRFGGLAISDWLYIGSLGFALFETLTVQKKHFFCWYKNPLLPAALLICLGAILSAINSKYLGIALIEIVQQVFVITVFVSLIWIMVRRGKGRAIILAFILSGLFTAVVAIFDFLVGSRFGPILSGTPDINLWGRYAGTLGHPNKFGYFLVLTALLSIGYFINSLQKQKKSTLFMLFWVVIIFTQIFGIYLSNSMTAYLGLLVGFMIFVFVFLTKKQIYTNISRKSKYLILIFGVLIIIFMIPTIRISTAVDFIQSAVDRVVTTTSASRIEVYKLSWERILQNPLVGVGYDQISTSGTGLVQYILGYSIHNALLQIWYTGGMIAFLGWLAIYLYILLLALKYVVNHTRTSVIVISIIATIFSILVMDQFQDSIYQREKWLVISIFLGFLLREKAPLKSLLPEKLINSSHG